MSFTMVFIVVFLTQSWVCQMILVIKNLPNLHFCNGIQPQDKFLDFQQGRGRGNLNMKLRQFFRLNTWSCQIAKTNKISGKSHNSPTKGVIFSQLLVKVTFKWHFFPGPPNKNLKSTILGFINFCVFLQLESLLREHL
jgi:hypothetical protein